METIPQIIRKLLKTERWIELHPYDVNNGNCDEFAYDIEKRALEVGHDVEVQQTDFDDDDLLHFWLYDKTLKRYYDAEEPEGVMEVNYLPIFNRNAQKSYRASADY
jgi:hypothetical protein